MDKKMRDLVESVTVALLSVRNAKGDLVIVPNPKKYAEYIAADLRNNPASRPQRRQSICPPINLPS